MPGNAGPDARRAPEWEPREHQPPAKIPPDYPWGDGRMEVPVYDSQPYPLWGLTARITYYLLKKVQA